MKKVRLKKPLRGRSRISVGSRSLALYRALYVTCGLSWGALYFVSFVCVSGWVGVLREAHRGDSAQQAEKHTRESHVSHEIESYTDRGRHMTAGPSGEMGAHGLERMQDMGDDRGSARRVPTRD